jgi:hypothetical protein
MLMIFDEFEKQIRTHQMSAPSNHWNGLGLVGWITLYQGEALPDKLSQTLRDLLNKTLKKVESLDHNRS